MDKETLNNTIKDEIENQKKVPKTQLKPPNNHIKLTKPNILGTLSEKQASNLDQIELAVNNKNNSKNVPKSIRKNSAKKRYQNP